MERLDGIATRTKNEERSRQIADNMKYLFIMSEFAIDFKLGKMVK